MRTIRTFERSQSPARTFCFAHLVLPLSVAGLLTPTAGFAQTADADGRTSTAVVTDKRLPQDVIVEPDVTFDTTGGISLKADLALPARGRGPFPAVLCIHGGGFVGGSRKDLAITYELAQRGYVAVAIDYRLAPRHAFPAQLHDAQAAVRWLRNNAGRFNVDPDRIGALGYSAGGTLASLLGSTGGDPVRDGAGQPGPSSRVTTVVSYYGIADFAGLYDAKVRCNRLGVVRLGYEFVLHGLFGGPPEQLADRYALASPLTHASNKCAPTLLLHGPADWKVPVEQSRAYESKLRAAGARVTLLEMANVGHDFAFDDGPPRDLGAAAAIAFLERELKSVRVAKH